MTLQVQLSHNVIVGRVLFDVDLAPLDQSLGLLVGERRAKSGPLAQIALILWTLGTKRALFLPKVTDGEATIAANPVHPFALPLDIVLHEHGLVGDKACSNSQIGLLVMRESQHVHQHVGRCRVT